MAKIPTTDEWVEKIAEEALDGYIYKGKTLREWVDILAQQPCEDCISRQALKSKLQEHHNFFVNAYGGFSNMSQNDKARVDEIINCISMVVNEPSVTPKEKSEYEHDHEVVKAYNDGQAYILDKIRAEIEQGYCKVENDYDKGRNMGLHIAMQIIDKYSEVSK